MNLQDIAYHRLASQQLTGTSFHSVKELVEWMGVMQAQDYAMAKWAVGIRLPGSALTQINAAIDSGEIIRTHLLRPTWHFVSAEDISWMLGLSADRIRAAAKTRLRELELSGAVLQKCNLIMERLLTGNKHLTREEIMAELARNKIATDNNRSSHILMQAELDGLICSGAVKGSKQTYALLAERIPVKTSITKDEALSKLASRYFTSHCPATLQDFTWWSGLSVSDARRGLEMIKTTLVSVVIASQTFWMPASFSFPVKSRHTSVHLLPAYDEFVISYTDRSATLNVENHKRSISNNGLFRPVILINGQVTGLWKRTVKKDRVLIETEFFRPHGKKLKNSINKAARTFGHFLGLNPQVSFETETAELMQNTDA